VTGLEAARLGQIRLGGVVGLPFLSIARRWRMLPRVIDAGDPGRMSAVTPIDGVIGRQLVDS
jgi:hypothetical protein